jgi:hypothetical protein
MLINLPVSTVSRVDALHVALPLLKKPMNLITTEKSTKHAPSYDNPDISLYAA